MRVAFITYEYPPDISAGGIATYVYETARMLIAKGVDVEIFAGSFTREGMFREDGIIINRCKIENTVDFSLKIAKVFRLRHAVLPFDLLETPEINANAQHIVAKFPELPYVTKLHTPVALQLKLYNFHLPLVKKLRFVLGALRRGKIDLGFWRRKERFPERDPDYRMAVGANVITAPSEAMKEWAVGYWSVAPDKIKVIENAYKPKDILLDQDYNSHERKYLTFIGKMNVHKGVVNLSKALPAILNEFPDLEVRFIGDDGSSHIPNLTMKEYVKQKLSSYKERIEFTGKIPMTEVYELLNEAKACIFPSIWEAFGYVVLESMSAGVPVIVSKGSGMEEIVKGGEYGLLIDPLSPRDISRRTIKLLGDDNILNNLSVAGRKRVIDTYSYESLFNKHFSLYSSVINK